MGLLTSWPEALYLGRGTVLDTVSDGFSMATARALAWASQLANETDDPAKLARILTDWGWARRRDVAGRMGGVLPLTSARGFVAEQRGMCVIAFAGTEPTNIADWIVDLSLRKTADGIHAGFASGVDAAWNSLVAPLADLSGPVVLAGHSLGGALAVVAAFRLVQDGVLPPDRLRGVYTFGMPRAGDGRFAERYRALGLAARTFRIVHGADIVASLPPAETPFAFRHVGARLSCAHGAAFRAEDLIADALEPPPTGGIGWLGFFQSALTGSPFRDLPGFPGDAAAAPVIDTLPPAFRDHVPDRYLRALGAM